MKAEEPSGWLADWMAYGRSTMMAPSEFILAAGIATLSATVGQQCWISLGGKRWFPHVWLLALGPAGTNKSTPIWRAEQAIRAARTPKAILPRRWSLEGFYSALEECHDGFWNAGEIAVFLRSASGRDYMAGAREELCDIWDSVPPTRRLRKEKLDIEPPAVSAIATGRHSDFAEAAGLSDFRSGFLSRFVLTWATEPGPYRGLVKRQDAPTEGEQAVEDAVWTTLVDDLRAVRHQLEGRVRPVAIDDDATDLWNECDEEWQREDVPDELSGFSKRRGIQSLKLAMLHGISRTGAPQVSLADMLWALGIVMTSWDRIGEFSGDVVGSTPAAARARRIFDRGRSLRNGKGEAVDASDWLRAVQGMGVKSKELNELFDTWREAGMIEVESVKHDGPGRPKRVVRFIGAGR